MPSLLYGSYNLYLLLGDEQTCYKWGNKQNTYSGVQTWKWLKMSSGLEVTGKPSY